MVRRLLPLLIALLTLAAVLPATAGADGPETSTDEIVGGTRTDIADHPWQVFVFADGAGCGGAIIEEKHVLTAAHCLQGIGPAKVQVGVGRSNWTKHAGTPSLVQAVEIIRHPSFDPRTFANDIAVIRTDRRLNYGPAAPIALDERLNAPKRGQILTVTGWGVTQFGGSAPNTLRQVKVPVKAELGDRTCLDHSEYRYFGGIMVCAGPTDGGRDACQGDSGGPAVSRHETAPLLTGITSWGIRCALPRLPGVYTRVAPYVPWLSTFVPGVGCDISGTDGPDVLIGTSGDDVICGLGGNDVIRGRGGHDVILGGPGDDDIYGSSGIDVLFGGDGDDMLRGAIGSDSVIGGAGDDDLFGAQGGDLLMGDGGSDVASAGRGNDVLLLGKDDDVGRGDIGNDLIRAGAGADQASGGKNADSVFGEKGHDVLFGGDGADFGNGGPGNDRCSAFETVRRCEAG